MYRLQVYAAHANRRLSTGSADIADGSHAPMSHPGGPASFRRLAELQTPPRVGILPAMSATNHTNDFFRVVDLNPVTAPAIPVTDPRDPRGQCYFGFTSQAEPACCAPRATCRPLSATSGQRHCRGRRSNHGVRRPRRTTARRSSSSASVVGLHPMSCGLQRTELPFAQGEHPVLMCAARAPPRKRDQNHPRERRRRAPRMSFTSRRPVRLAR